MARRAASISRAFSRSGSSEVQGGAGLGGAMDTAFELLAEFCALG
jgi:hypothetical protein